MEFVWLECTHRAKSTKDVVIDLIIGRICRETQKLCSSPERGEAQYHSQITT